MALPSLRIHRLKLSSFEFIDGGPGSIRSGFDSFPDERIDF